MFEEMDRKLFTDSIGDTITISIQDNLLRKMFQYMLQQVLAQH